MIPKTLNEWNYETVTALCSAGQSESDRHDFKFNLPDSTNVTKLSCAFANTYGGFIVLGVKDQAPLQFDVVGIDPDKELYGNFVAKVKADPEIAISLPKAISVPRTNKLLYVVEIPQSGRRPHLPSAPDQRYFWKRQGSACVQMTLEEIRYQMNTYEEKREKLALLLIDLHHKARSLEQQARNNNDRYTGDMFSFDVIDRVVVEAFTLLKADVNILGALDTLRQHLMLLNVEEQRMLLRVVGSHDTDFNKSLIGSFCRFAESKLPAVSLLVEQIERSIGEKFGVANPYKAR